MDPYAIIDKHFLGAPAHPQARALLLTHSEHVARKSLELALRVRALSPDLDFVREAALLHDIGIYLTNSPRLGCTGSLPYICHGHAGAEILRAEGLPRHALLTERHVGVGLTAIEIRQKGFPLPERDMVPETIEEILVCVADKFFSKHAGAMDEKPLDRVRKEIKAYGPGKLAILDGWLEMLGIG